MSIYRNYWLDHNKVLHEIVEGKKVSGKNVKTLCGLEAADMDLVSGPTIRQKHGCCKECIRLAFKELVEPRFRGKLKTKKVVKAPLAQDEERLIENPPYTIFGNTSIPSSFCITMKAGGLRKMLDEFKLDGEDTFRIEVFSGARATEFSFIKHKKK